ncbi:HAUS augmin-like complex subunit 3 [Chionoecetes opilio]|uniref:HAUS augmin-like complex subunit 3 n=1 Tax=Chionoecetes opilio TaxID=41210 RepID=A0A8J4XNJ6_CHIOP|nr:HAUS augmin-like complex subunit 3 [Chionoecetes opilio]
MSGEQLVRQLQLLAAPGSEQLVGETYDWLFLSAAGSPLAVFLQWFMDNITPNNVLTEEELNEFEALEAAGEVMSASQLQEMEGAVTCLPGLPGAEGRGRGERLPSPEELEALEEELKVLTRRKNMINVHKIELCEETQRLSGRVGRGEGELRRQVEAVGGAEYHYTKAQQNLAGMVDAQLSTFHKFGDAGVGVVSVTEDSSQSVLRDTPALDLTLVCGVGQEQYCRNVAELNRLSALLPQTEEWRLQGVVLQERRKAEVQEAERLLAALHQRHLPSDLTVLRQQTQEAQESLALLEKEHRQQQQALRGVLGEGAELETTKVLAADYEVKIQHQEYLLAKQAIVLDQLVSQAARHNWVIIALETEGRRVTDTLQVLKMINTTMTHRDAHCRNRMVLLEAMLNKSEEAKAAGVLPLPLHTLSRLLPPPRQGKAAAGGRGALGRQVAGLLGALTQAQDQVNTFTSPQFSCLDQMVSICEVLEASLFGSAGSLQALPLAWLDAPLAHRCTHAQQRVWEFKQKLISVIAQYEKKKKIVQLDPAVTQDLRKWIAEVITKFNELTMVKEA